MKSLVLCRVLSSGGQCHPAQSPQTWLYRGDHHRLCPRGDRQHALYSGAHCQGSRLGCAIPPHRAHPGGLEGPVE